MLLGDFSGKVAKDSQVPEVLVVVQVFVVNGGEAALVGDVSVRRCMWESEREDGGHLSTRRRKTFSPHEQKSAEV